jgi:TorA maturation chaperone TorD
VRTFLQQRGMPLAEAPADHFGQLLLAASWLEDQSQEDEAQAQIALFDEFLLPWCGRFLGKVEAHATTGFYRTLALMTRDAIQAMRDELAEYEQDDEAGDEEA